MKLCLVLLMTVLSVATASEASNFRHKHPDNSTFGDHEPVWTAADVVYSPRAPFAYQPIEISEDFEREALSKRLHDLSQSQPEDVNSSSGSDDAEETWSPHVQYAIRAGYTQSRGVNLGGWLVTEAWMTSSAAIFQGVDAAVAHSGEQQAFTHAQPRETAEDRFWWHRDNFVTEEEIRKIAAAGLNTVRVPVGYWIVGFDNHDSSGKKQWQNFAPGGLAFLDRLIRDWAKKHNVAVLISMHGAKGSQNGADHSAPEQPGKSLWSHYPENVASTLDAVAFLAARYKDEEAFLGIGLLNEPSGDTDWRVLYKYYEDAYKAIRLEQQNDCILTIAPLLWEQSANFMTGVLPGATNVWVEWHRYFVWGYEQSSPDELLGSAIDAFRRDVEDWKRKSNKKMYIGEFSFATAGKFHDAGSLAEFGRRQLRVLRETVDGGWAFWSWRVYEDEYGANPWSLRSLIDRGIFPLQQ